MNLTDGIDGLCTSVTFIVVAFFALVLWQVNRSAAWYPLALGGAVGMALIVALILVLFGRPLLSLFIIPAAYKLIWLRRHKKSVS